MKTLINSIFRKVTLVACILTVFFSTESLAAIETGNSPQYPIRNSFGLRYSHHSLGLVWRHSFNQISHFEAQIMPISANSEEQFDFYGGRFIHRFPQKDFPFTPFVFGGIGVSNYSKYKDLSVLVHHGLFFAYSIGHGVETQLGRNLLITGDVAIARLNNEPNQMLGIIRLGFSVQYILK